MRRLNEKQKKRIYIIGAIFMLILIIFSGQKAYAEKIPEKYDLREHINVRVKDQMQTMFCWAFSQMSCIETNLALRENKYYDFSEKHLVYATVREFLNGETNPYGGTELPTEGKDRHKGYQYFINGLGPIDEKEMPFDNKQDLIDISEIQGKTVKKHTKDYIRFPSISKIRNRKYNDL